MLEIQFSGHKLRLRRQMCGFTQQELADALGVNYFTVQSWERGRFEPNPHNLIKLARALNCRVQDLYAVVERGVANVG